MTDRYSRYLSRFLIALPVLSLALGAIAWLRYGMDMPFYDDWRGYYDGNIGSFDPGYLFRATNDTLAPIGFALDAVAQHLLDGNSVAYQFLSMILVLGSLLLLQWKLLQKILGNNLQAAACFSLTVLMLQPGSYWGLENLAYCQALPLVFILAALWLIVCADDTRGWHWVAIPLLGLLAGFAYISGAFAALAAGVVLLVFARSCYTGEARRLLVWRAALFTVAGAITVAAQSYLSIWKFHAKGTHVGIPLAWPNEPQFWMFYLGKIGRSLLLSPGHPKSSLAITLLACTAAIGIGLAVYSRARSTEATVQDKRLAGIYISLSAVVFVYLMLVAAGRTNFRAPEIERLLDIYAYGFTRFHFFWVTLLWPWVAAGIVCLARRAPRIRRPAAQWSGVMLVLLLAGLMAESGAYDHMRAHRETLAERLPLAHCLLDELEKGGEIRCLGLVPPGFTNLVPDAYPAYLNALKLGASFVRYFPILPRAKRREDMAPFYAMNDADAAANTKTGDKPVLVQLKPVGNNGFRAVGGDPQIHVKTRQPQTMRQCTTLDVDVIIKTSLSDMVQVFFLPTKALEYSEQNSVRLPISDEAMFHTLNFRFESQTGFQDALRIDPVTQPQALAVKDIRVYCVRRQP